MTKSRDELKKAFRSGAVPTASDFAALIDSAAQIDDLAPLVKSIAELSSRAAAVEQNVQPPTTRTLEANGQWQVLKSGLDTVCAYEIVAEIDKTPSQTYEALTVAIVAGGGAGVRPSLQQTRSYSGGPWSLVQAAFVALGALAVLPAVAAGLTSHFAGLGQVAGLGAVLSGLAEAFNGKSAPFFVDVLLLVIALAGVVASRFFRDRRALDVAWRKAGKWYDLKADYDLALRSRCDYGGPTQKVAIACRIRRISA